MSKPKNYNEVEVLEKAMYILWEKGYHNVSTRELATTMGINQFSLYASFKNKENLFKKALEHYFNFIIKKGIAVELTREKLTVKNLVKFLNNFKNPNQDIYSNGCLICNTMVGQPLKNSDIDYLLTEYKLFLVDAFKKIIKTTKPKLTKIQVNNKSNFLYGTLIGLIIERKNGLSNKDAKGYVQSMLDSINSY